MNETPVVRNPDMPRTTRRTVLTELRAWVLSRVQPGNIIWTNAKGVWTAPLVIESVVNDTLIRTKNMAAFPKRSKTTIRMDQLHDWKRFAILTPDEFRALPNKRDPFSDGDFVADKYFELLRTQERVEAVQRANTRRRTKATPTRRAIAQRDVAELAERIEQLILAVSTEAAGIRDEIRQLRNLDGFGLKNAPTAPGNGRDQAFTGVSGLK